MPGKLLAVHVETAACSSLVLSCLIHAALWCASSPAGCDSPRTTLLGCLDPPKLAKALQGRHAIFQADRVICLNFALLTPIEHSACALLLFQLSSTMAIAIGLWGGPSYPAHTECALWCNSDIHSPQCASPILDSEVLSMCLSSILGSDSAHSCRWQHLEDW